jgi:hypothetical protein
VSKPVKYRMLKVGEVTIQGDEFKTDLGWVVCEDGIPVRYVSQTFRRPITPKPRKAVKK